MKKATVREPQLTRERLANPWIDIPLKERLINSKAIDLRDNHTIEDLGNGYIKIIPIDPNKLWKGE